MTICENCKHLVQGPSYPDRWGYLCGKAERVPTVDPVTGQPGYAGKNDLGGPYVTGERFESCRSVNLTGECKMYEKA